LAHLVHLRDDRRRAAELSEQALAACRQVGDEWGAAMSLMDLGVLALAEGQEARAGDLFDQSLALFRAAGDRWGIAAALSRQAVAHRRGDRAEMRRLLDEALAMVREVGEQRQLAEVLRDVGSAAMLQGEIAPARACWAEAADHFRAIRDKAGLATAL